MRADKRALEKVTKCELEDIIMIDTPGYEDMDVKDREVLAEVISIVKEIGYINLIILCIDVNQPRNDDC